MLKLPVKLKTPYDIYIAQDLLQRDFIFDYIKGISDKCVVIADDFVGKIYGKQFLAALHSHGFLQAKLITFPAGEQSKTREIKQEIEDEMLRDKYGRDVVIVALGGGVTTDLAGFIASTYNRGVPIVYCPTSMLAMVDASIGGKTAVNTPFGKNLVGTFFQPTAVFIDVSTLDSLPEKEYKYAFVEILVHSLVYDKTMFETVISVWEKLLQKDRELLSDLIYKNCQIKAAVVEKDEKDTGLRNILNFGHTIGHAIECCLNYKIGHGKAVAVGIVVESYISLLAGHLSPAVFEKIKICVRRIDPNLNIPLLSKGNFYNAMRLDKKSLDGRPRFIMLSNIGCVYHVSDQYSFAITDEILEKAFEYLVNEFNREVQNDG